MNVLDKILNMTIEEQVCQITYTKKDMERHYNVQFFDITSAYGQWYATAYNFQAGRPQVFRCDKIQSVQQSSKYQAKSIAEFSATPREIFRDSDAIDFVIGISLKGVDIFHKEHYPSMELFHEDGKYFVKGFYNKGEENFITNYFLIYGDTITSILPT